MTTGSGIVPKGLVRIDCCQQCRSLIDIPGTARKLNGTTRTDIIDLCLIPIGLCSPVHKNVMWLSGHDNVIILKFFFFFFLVFEKEMVYQYIHLF